MIKKIAGIILVFVLAFSSSPGFTEEPTNHCSASGILTLPQSHHPE